jgi:hypothetical protein
MYLRPPFLENSMKKTLTLVALAVAGSAAFGQAQRLVLFEEFTQASCGPCASQNPAFNTLLDANATKAVSIKYQTSWPGFDPMNLHNPTDVATRVSFYGVNGVPWTAMDGVAPTGSAYAGAPANVTASSINTRYAVASDYSVTVAHQFTANNDSVEFVVYVTNATQNSITNANLKLHLGLVEKAIEFPTAPGNNGETEFYMVMRKMIPDASGTAIPATMASGTPFVFTAKVAVPSYVYKLAEVAMVAWVQDMTTKDVKNAGYSAPQPLNGPVFDAGILSVAQHTGGLCNTAYTPSATVTNAGTSAITSAAVQYILNGGTPVVQNWTGNLAAGASVAVNFPAVTLAGGANTFAYSVGAPNGKADANTMNNSVAPLRISTIGATPVATPYNEGLEAATTTALPANSGLIQGGTSPRLFVLDKSAAGTTQNIGGFAQSDKSIMMDFYLVAAGGTLSVTTQKLNLSGLTNPKLFFQHAHAQYDGSEPDQLKVSASTDCGATWTTLFDKTGNQLATRTPVGNNTRFFPTATEWKQNSISLSQYAGNAGVVLKFEGISGYGNSLFLDNIWVSNNALGNEELTGAALSVFPNPASDVARIALNLNDNSQVSVSLTNLNGQVVAELPARALEAGNHELALPVAGLPNGVYTARVVMNDAVQTVRLTVAH